MNKLSDKRGYALLVSIIVISMILLIIATVGARRVQNNYFAAIDLRNLYTAQSLAEACVDYALIQLAQNPDYSGNESVTVGSDFCQIVSASPTLVQSQGVSEEHYYRLEVSLSSISPVTISGWQRVVSF